MTFHQQRRIASATRVASATVVLAMMGLGSVIPAHAQTSPLGLGALSSRGPGSSPSPSTSAVTPPVPSGNDLREAVRQQAAAVASAQVALEQSTRDAAAALEEYSKAVQAMQLAKAEEIRQQQALDQAQATLESQRAALGRWASKAYSEGNGLGADPTLATILGGSADDVSAAQHWLKITGQQRGADVSAFEVALREQQRIAKLAEAASTASRVAVTTAETTKKSRDEAVKRQQTQLAALQAQLITTQAAVAAEDARQAALLAQARVYAAKQAARVAAAKAAAHAANNRVSGIVGTCSGGQPELFPNGQIPLAELCPLWGAPGHHLRADAAFAFDKMSNAYARQFGKPICVTDSYRTYDEQVRLKAAKPNLAATPGTSNHGWGTALDLCGGIQSFGTDTHNWMLVNAPAFGWFHPAWARQSGSKPEAWHWEFGG